MNKASFPEFMSHYKSIENELIKQLVVIDFDIEYSRKIDSFKEIDNDKDIVVDVKGEKWFNKSFAINIGASLASLENIIICDADVLISRETLENWARMIDLTQQIISPEYLLETLNSKRRSAPGICCLKKSAFLQVDGYSSRYIGWGFEDHDFIFRLKRNNFQVYLNGWGYHITHDDFERTRNYYSQNKAEMRSKNLSLFEARCKSSNSSGSYYLDVNSCKISKISHTHFTVSRYVS
jgi:predicted glycosyltransferase involved in capsule biosynthesis